MTDTVKFRLVGDRANVKTMIEALDAIVDNGTEWRIFPQRNGIGVSAYLEAHPRNEDSAPAEQDDAAQDHQLGQEEPD